MIDGFDQRIYLDTNVLIKAFEARDDISEALNRLLFCKSSTRQATFVTSALTFAELLVLPLRNKNVALIETYRNWSKTSAYLEVVALESKLLMYSAVLRARNRTLKLPDAIHIATAATMQCRLLLSFDRRLSSAYEIADIDNDERQKIDRIEVDCPDVKRIDALINMVQNV